ncbi:MAG: pilus assembly protein PilM [Holophagaceae bacterium]|nr:pilus assembly protein PilM [Holophagaceae bacterium]
MSGKNKLLVGLDIGSSAVKVCELQYLGKKGGPRYQLQKLGIVPIPPDSIVDGDIMDTNAVVSAIRQVIADQKIKTKEVAISVSGQQVIVKKVTLQIMGHSELEESIRWEAESFFPTGQSLDSYALDYVIIEERKAEGNMDVLLVACRKDKLDSYRSCVIQAGVKPVIADLDVFALQNVFEANQNPGGYEEVVALVNIGANFTNLCMMIGSKSVFWRDLLFGGNKYTSKLMDDWSVTREGAEDLKQGRPAENREPAEVESSMAAVSEALADELSRNIEFFRTNFKIDRVDKIVLAGGGSKVSNLVEVIKERFRVNVERLNPFNLIEDGSKGTSGSEEIGCAASVAVGLALREEGDR